MKIKKEKIILDVDTGTDDAFALILAEKSGKFNIQGITTVAGNTNLRQVIENTLKVLNLMGRLDIPIFKGASKPLKGKGRRSKTQGRDGFCEVYLPLPKQKLNNVKAEDYIAKTVSEHPKEITIVATAPLTNIAKTIKKYPEIKNKIKRIIIMGGVVEVSGNVTEFSEFNFYNDPEAGKIVFESKVPIILIPLDVTMKLLLKRNWLIKKYKKSKDKITKFIINVVNNRYKLVGKDWMYLHDPLAVGVAINKNFVQTKKDRLEIITSGKQKGKIIKNKKGERIEWAFKVKEKEFLDYFEKTLLKL